METNSRLVPCPQCGELVSKRARVCPHCQHALKATPVKFRIWAVGMVILTVLVVLSNQPWFSEVWSDATVSNDDEWAATVTEGPDEWPTWRGANYDNVAYGEPPPTAWSESKNILWKASVPGLGHGSPIVVGKYVFLATADESEKTTSLVCFLRETGKSVWTTEIHRGGFMHKGVKNSYASSSPACDGKRLFIPFIHSDGLWLTAVDFDGNIVWQQQVAEFESEHGYASSPLVYKSNVIVAGDNLKGSYLSAVDGETGQVVWQVPRSQGGSYSSPALATLAMREQLLLSGQGEVTSYDPVSGRSIWTARAMTDSLIGTVAWWQDRVYAASYDGTVCVQTDGSGNVTDTKTLWQRRVRANVPSPLVYGNRLFIVQDEGIIHCLHAATGDTIYTERLGGNISASPVGAGGHVYIPNEDGRMFVIRAGGDFEVVAENDLNDGGFASPVILGGRIYLRTLHHLYCIGKE